MMPQLEIYRWEDASILSHFNCDVPAMDNFIHNRLGQFLCKHDCQMYVVFDANGDADPIAMFVVSKGKVSLDKEMKDNVHQMEPVLYDSLMRYEQWQCGEFPALELDYLAIRKDYRGKHIGYALMNAIYSLAKRIVGDDCRFVGVDAYCTTQYSSVSFYRKCAFFVAGPLMPGEDTVRMFHILS